MSIKHWELYFLRVIRGKDRGFLPSMLKNLLFIFSCPYRIAIALRNWAFDHGWVRSYYPPIPLVISIGNITAGGTGKTPVTLMMAQEFYKKIPLAVLSRGYRSKAEKFSSPILMSRGHGAIHPASFCGDEAYLIAQNLPEAIVIVGRDRRKASNIAAREGAQLVLLDDGMQYRKIARDLEVIVMDALDPFGQGHFLPRGLLREGKNSLSRADLIIINHAQDLENYEAIKQQISRWTSAPVVGVEMRVSSVQNLQGEKIESLQQKKVGIFCGIAHPDYFKATVQKQGAEITDEYFMPDHDMLDPEELVRFGKTCAGNGAEMLVCTEKDRVKITNSIQVKLPIAWIKSHLQIIDGLTHWESFISKGKGALNI